MGADSILIVYYNLGIGGVQRKIYDLARHLNKKYPKKKIHILLRDQTPHEIFAPAIKPYADVVYYSKTLAHIPFFFSFFLLHFMIRKRIQSVLVFSGLLTISVMLAKSLLVGRPITVCVSEDGPFSLTHETQRRPFSYLRTMLYRLCFPFVHQVLCVNMALAKDLMENFHAPQHRTHVVNNWTHIPRHSSHRYKKQYDLLYIGRFDKEKNLMALLVALKKVRKKIPTIRLALMGEGSEKKQLLDFIRVHNLQQHVVFLSPQVNITGTLLASRVFILPSYAEGQSIVTLEALAHGLPVICRFSTSVAPQLQPLLHMYKTDKKLAACITEVFKGHETSVSPLARTHIRRYFSKDNMLAYIEALIGLT
jgi:glycosyltransferase involved in cell wall biosynthesis